LVAKPSAAQAVAVDSGDVSSQCAQGAKAASVAPGSAGVGLGGQRLYIVPSLDLVVLVHAGLYQSPQQGVAPLVVLDSVLRAVEAP
jgi:hypothetical protein